MKDLLKKLYRKAKYLVPILTVVLLLPQIPAEYINLIDQIQEIWISSQE